MQHDAHTGTILTRLLWCASAVSLLVLLLALVVFTDRQTPLSAIETALVGE
jgi:hypothetical protein